MRFFALAALFGFVAVSMTSARPGPSRLDQDIWERDDSSSSQCDGSAMQTCAIALAPTVGACGIAALQAEIDVVTDAACITAAIALEMNFPSECTACAKRFGDDSEDLGDKITNKLHL